MLRKIRIVLAALCLVGVTLLFVGIGRDWWGWLPKLQLMPATMRIIAGAALGNIAVVLCIFLLTWLFGRIYCSVLCPLGVFQDLVLWLRRTLGRWIKPLRKKFKFNKERRWVRYPVAAAFIGCVIVDLQLVVALLEPYSAYGRMVSAATGGDAPLLIAAGVTLVVIVLCAWIWGRAWCNTVCPVGTVLGCVSKYSLFGVCINESICVSCGSCEHVCKASCIDAASKTVDRSRCIDCFDCLGSCKKNAIRFAIGSFSQERLSETPTIPLHPQGTGEGSPDTPSVAPSEASPLATIPLHPQGTGEGSPDTPSVAPSEASPLATIPLHPQGTGEGSPDTPSVAPSELRKPDQQTVNQAAGSKNVEIVPETTEIAANGRENDKNPSKVDKGRRAFIATSAMVVGAGVTAAAQEKKVDGGLAPLETKTPLEREPRLVPPGAGSVKNFYDRCTACQLCVQNCPNGVLRPSTDINHFLQPQMGYENGFCRPECTACSEVCPAGAIKPLAREAKTLVRIGTAVVNPELCLAAKGEAGCGHCAKVCPSGAISMVRVDGKRRPVVAEEQCIGCGKCEFLCPSRPVSAITVKGLETHRNK